MISKGYWVTAVMPDLPDEISKPLQRLVARCMAFRVPSRLARAEWRPVHACVTEYSIEWPGFIEMDLGAADPRAIKQQHLGWKLFRTEQGFVFLSGQLHSTPAEIVAAIEAYKRKLAPFMPRKARRGEA